MHADRDHEPRKINCTALRTLHALERTLRRHIDELMALECEDMEAADALVFATESAERALEKARDARRRILRGD
jgi:uncharacterized protein YdeI (YjbR/CyaY-like superfamily)